MTPDIDSCYSILGVRHGATPDEVKHAYRELVREWHPDRLAHDARRQKIAEEKLKEINVAYERVQRHVQPAHPHSAARGAPVRPTRGRSYSAYGAGWQRATATAPPPPSAEDEETLFARAWALYEEGRARFAEGAYAEAISNLTQAVCLKPNVGDAYAMLGRAHTELGSPAKAASAYKQAIRFSPDRLDACDGLARSYLAMGAAKEAVWVCSQTLKRKPRAIALRVTLGAAYRKLGQTAQSLEALTGALEQEPDNAQARYEMGETYVAIGDRGAARRIYAGLKELDTDLAVQLLLSIVGAGT